MIVRVSVPKTDRLPAKKLTDSPLHFSFSRERFFSLDPSQIAALTSKVEAGFKAI
jgi:hypothetical protein